MYIVNVAFEALGFDPRMMRGGTASLVWNLAREYAAAGHRVCVVTPAHGCADYLAAHYEVEELPYRDDHTVPVVLDRRVWTDHPAQLSLSLTTCALRLRHQGVDVYLLSDEYLDLLPDQFYPMNEMQGSDLAYLKPLLFQVAAVRFIDNFLAGGPLVVHGYEPLYHYLLPPVFAGRPDRTVMSTVAMNPPINGKVYRPQLERLLAEFGTVAGLDRFTDPVRSDPLQTAMANHLRPSHLRRDYGPDYTCNYSLVAAYTDVIDFVSPGQRDYYSTFRDTPSERFFERSTVSTVVRETAAKQLVGGCALPDWWLDRDPTLVDRAAVLGGLGLDPARPTFYHAARFDQNHKGQLELFRAIDAVLAQDREVNFVVRCAVGTSETRQPAGNPYFQQVADRYPANVHLDWRMVPEELLFEQAAVAEYCLFPSKFELDGFLITLGEAMALGAVPVATAQETLSHYGHHRPVSDPHATGFAVARSFRTDDSRLTQELTHQIREALRTYREEPDTYRRLSANARSLARSFTWRRCATARLDRLKQVRRGQPQVYPVERAIEYGWFDRLTEADWIHHRDRIAEVALDRGDLEVYRRCRVVDRVAVERLFDAAYRRGDLVRCEQLAELLGGARAELARDRYYAEHTGDGWRLVYHLPVADQVELILPWQVSPDAGSGNRYVHPLSRAGKLFTTVLPAPDHPRTPDHPQIPDHLRTPVFLLTLSNGRIAWDAPAGSRWYPARR